MKRTRLHKVIDAEKATLRRQGKELAKKLTEDVAFLKKCMRVRSPIPS